MGENAKRQDGDHRMLWISLLKSIKLHVLYFSTQRLRVNIFLYVKNIFCRLD